MSLSPGLFFNSASSSPPPVPEFISIWTTPNTVQLPLISSGTYDFMVDWGDGNSDHITVWNQAESNHTYSGAGTYTITISGTCYGWSFVGSGDTFRIVEISNWGTGFRLGNGGQNFKGAQNLTITAPDALDLTGTTNFNQLFYQCFALTSLGSGAHLWDVSSVTNFNECFRQCTSFNDSGIASWDVTSGTNFSSMFKSCTSFNSAVNFVTSAGITFDGMFDGCTAFDKSINTFVMSNATNVNRMLHNCSSYNRTMIWNLSKATDLTLMFGGCTALTHDPIFTLNTTDPGVDLTAMFLNCSNFNSPAVSDYDVSMVAHFDQMFQGCTVFNQPLPWTLSTDTVTFGVGCSLMFFDATAWNQDISSWYVIAVYDFSNFLTGAAFNTANYDALLIAWSGQAVTTGVEFDTDAKYTAGGGAEFGRLILTGTKSWTITDGGPV